MLCSGSDHRALSGHSGSCHWQLGGAAEEEAVLGCSTSSSTPVCWAVRWQQVWNGRRGVRVSFHFRVLLCLEIRLQAAVQAALYD
jgi:hypothetical protein